MADVRLRECPTEEGGMVWLFTLGERYAMIELDEDGEVTALTSDRASGTIEAWDAPLRDLMALLGQKLDQ